MNFFEDAKMKADAIMATAKAMANDETAMARMGTPHSAFGKIVGLFIIAILVGTVFVVGLQSLATANTSGLSVAEIALIAVVGLILVVGVIWLVLQYVGLV